MLGRDSLDLLRDHAARHGVMTWSQAEVLLARPGRSLNACERLALFHLVMRRDSGLVLCSTPEAGSLPVSGSCSHRSKQTAAPSFERFGFQFLPALAGRSRLESSEAMDRTWPM